MKLSNYESHKNCFNKRIKILYDNYKLLKNNKKYLYLMKKKQKSIQNRNKYGAKNFLKKCILFLKLY